MWILMIVRVTFKKWFNDFISEVINSHIFSSSFTCITPISINTIIGEVYAIRLAVRNGCIHRERWIIALKESSISLILDFHPCKLSPRIWNRIVPWDPSSSTCDPSRKITNNFPEHPAIYKLSGEIRIRS